MIIVGWGDDLKSLFPKPIPLFRYSERQSVNEIWPGARRETSLIFSSRNIPFTRSIAAKKRQAANK